MQYDRRKNCTHQRACQKAKTEGLTDAEKKEQQELRAEYVADFRKSLKAQLDNTVVVNPDGSSYKLKQDKSDAAARNAEHAIRRLERAGFEGVGGRRLRARQSARSRTARLQDLCTSASPAQMRAAFADAVVLHDRISNTAR